MVEKNLVAHGARRMDLRATNEHRVRTALAHGVAGQDGVEAVPAVLRGAVATIILLYLGCNFVVIKFGARSVVSLYGSRITSGS